MSLQLFLIVFLQVVPVESSRGMSDAFWMALFALIGTIGTLIFQFITAKKVTKTHDLVNSKMKILLQKVALVSHAEGKEEERERQEGKDLLVKGQEVDEEDIIKKRKPKPK